MIKYLLNSVLWGLCFMSLSTYSQISPGDLSVYHEHLEGISNCTKCHVLGEQVSEDKCLECHQLLNRQIKNNRGYHVSAEVKAKKCYECHNDHFGRDFKIIKFDTINFDHSLTSYLISGAHLELKCADCHSKKNILDLDIKEKKFTYLGLNSDCRHCHEDVHQNTLGGECLKCHTDIKFKPASKFKHDQTNYKLEGKHELLTCEKCHEIGLRNGLQYQKFAGIAYASCTSCHEDVHQTKFGQDCLKCHTMNSFKDLNLTSSFDHNLTRFKLLGKHTALECKDCHKQSIRTALAYQNCYDCHEDYHKGQFTLNAIQKDCKECHSEQSFKKSSYSIDSHQKSNFPLKGAHQATPCFECHKKNDRWEFKNIGVQCVDCHKDIHSGFISRSYYPNAECKICHSEKTWKQIQFDHAQTSFKLEGVHLKSSCALCHIKDKNLENQKFKDLSSDCIECHDDVHNAQFKIKGRDACVRCHGFEHWLASKFDHNKSNFKLEGKHLNVACKDCHPRVNVNNKNYTKFKLNLFKCEDCH